MPHAVESHIVELSLLKRPPLCDLWKEHFGVAPPSSLRRDFMIPMLAYRIQEQAFGSLSAANRSRLRQLARSFQANPEYAVPSSLSLKAGTRLVRQWRGQVHLVNVEAESYEYQGGRYRSLSEIARLITGTRWSGPVFFGIKTQKISKPEEAA